MWWKVFETMCTPDCEISWTIIFLLYLLHIFVDNQFRFRRLHSSYMVLLLIEQPKFWIMLIVWFFFQFANAFGILIHRILIEKFIIMASRIIPWNVLKATSQIDVDMCHTMVFVFVRNWLYWCSWKVFVWAIITPSYIDDLCKVCCESVPILFAEDTNLFYKGNKLVELVKISMMDRNIYHYGESWIKFHWAYKRHT